MKIIEIKGDKKSKSRYKVLIAGMEKRNKCFEAFATTIDKENPRAKLPAGDFIIRGKSKKKTMEQIMAVIATFPPEEDLPFIDMTSEREVNKIE